MKKTAIIVAGGSGSRMQTEIPKQFLELEGQVILVHTVSAFLQAYEDITLIIVLPKFHLEKGRRLILEAFPEKQIIFSEGGQTRFESVKSGLSKVQDECIIFVHDAVRCLVTPDLIQKCYKESLQKGSAIPVIQVKDSIRLIDDKGSRSIDRDYLRAVQTPQTFRSDILIPSFSVKYQNAFTDEATVVEANGISVNLVEGEETNIKITVPTDLYIANEVIRKRRSK